jgi:hypothetical protein
MKKVAYTLITSAVLACCAMLALPTRAHAQCQFTDYSLNQDGVSLDNGGYTDSNPPYVYINLQTNGQCANTPFTVSVTESDSLTLNSVFDNDVFGVDDQSVVAPSMSNFTLVLRAGDISCDEGENPECQYYVKINGNLFGLPPSVTSWSQIPVNKRWGYACDGPCSKGWQYITIVPYQAFYFTPACGNVVTGGVTYPQCCAGAQVDANGWGWDSTLQQSCYMPPVVTNTSNNTSTTGSTNTGSTTNDTVDAIVIQINNPLTGIDSVMQFIKKILDLAVTIGVPILAIFIMYSGFLFITARGDMSKIKDAKNTLLNAIIGGAILLGAWVIAQAIKNTVAEIVASISSFIG